jgi:hypothetical protein
MKIAVVHPGFPQSSVGAKNSWFPDLLLDLDGIVVQRTAWDFFHDHDESTCFLDESSQIEVRNVRACWVSRKVEFGLDLDFIHAPIDEMQPCFLRFLGIKRLNF